MKIGYILLAKINGDAIYLIIITTGAGYTKPVLVFILRSYAHRAKIKIAVLITLGTEVISIICQYHLHILKRFAGAVIPYIAIHRHIVCLILLAGKDKNAASN
jgi:hypothetical protein